MSDDPRVARMARVVVERMLDVDGGLLVLSGPASAAPLHSAIARAAGARGATVYVAASPDGVDAALLDGSSTSTLSRPDPIEEFIADRADYLVRILAAENAPVALPPEKVAARLAGRRDVVATRMRRGADGSLRWAVVMHPTEGHARQAGLGLACFADLVYAAAKCDRDDPIAAWAAFAERQERLRAFLETGSELRILGEGTDLTVSVAGRAWRSSAANRNLPDGEVFTGPVEDSAEGQITFTYPADYRGMRAEGVRLVFERGVVVEATARKGQEALDAALALDPGARRLGEVAIGTNDAVDRFTSHILLDEKMGGTVHVALGAGYPETGSTSTSALHWDMISDLRRGGAVLLDGREVLRDGRLVDVG